MFVYFSRLLYRDLLILSVWIFPKHYMVDAKNFSVMFPFFTI